MFRLLSYSIARPKAFSMQGQRTFHSSSVVRHGGGFSVHKDTAENNANTPFDFTTENYEKIKTILAKYPPHYKSAATIPLLHLAQSQVGWVPLAAMNKIAKILEIPNMTVYEVATFYTMFERNPTGKYKIEVCTTTPCMIRGAYDIVKALEKHLSIPLGGATPDRMFSLHEVECLGACVNAPMLNIGEHYYEDLTEETAIKVIEALKRGEQPKPGPQTESRRVAEPPGGKTTLLEPPRGPYCRPDL